MNLAPNPYVVRLRYDSAHGEKNEGTYASYIAAVRAFDDCRVNLGHCREIYSVELVIRGVVERTAPERNPQ